MSKLPVTSISQWDHEKIVEFLQSAVIPMRLAINDETGFPRLCSLWFAFDGQNIVAATHDKALVTQLLKKDNRCAFEIATNVEPYYGVRGQARAELILEQGKAILPVLIEKYIAKRHPRLQKWLMSRINEEYAVRLHIEWISAWDYSDRMKVDE
jgi:nitroimidazol reductase NimA-like FMN-containing flavoprotein (pyridoxamine 5'-phosphate oxidase superfamily)